MIKARIKDDEYHIPTKWQEITYSQYVRLIKASTPNESISIVSGIPIDIIDRMEEDQQSKIVILLGFMHVEFHPEMYLPPKEVVINRHVSFPFIQDIKEGTFGQKLYFGELMKGKIDLIELLPEIVAIYAQPIIQKTKFDLNKLAEVKELLQDVFFVDLYSIAVNYIEQLKKILEKEKETLTASPDQEQIAAGIAMFEPFGVMNTIKALANNDVTKYEQVLEIEYNTIFTTMHMNKVQNDFDRNYRKVMEQKNKRR